MPLIILSKYKHLRHHTNILTLSILEIKGIKVAPKGLTRHDSAESKNGEV